MRKKTQWVRRSHILDAAITVFARRGFHAATIRDIAREAGVADGTIYNHFKNKMDLLVHLLDPRGDAAPASIPAMDPDVFFEGLFHRRWEDLTPRTLDVLRIVLSEALVDAKLRDRFFRTVIRPAHSHLEPVLQKLTADGTLRPCDSALTSRALTALVLGHVLLNLLGDKAVRERWGEIPALLATITKNGLTAQKKQRGIHGAV